jgi:hypothetical protein
MENLCFYLGLVLFRFSCLIRTRSARSIQVRAFQTALNLDFQCRLYRWLSSCALRSRSQAAAPADLSFSGVRLSILQHRVNLARCPLRFLLSAEYAGQVRTQRLPVRFLLPPPLGLASRRASVVVSRAQGPGYRSSCRVPRFWSSLILFCFAAEIFRDSSFLI